MKWILKLKVSLEQSSRQKKCKKKDFKARTFVTCLETAVELFGEVASGQVIWNPINYKKELRFWGKNHGTPVEISAWEWCVRVYVTLHATCRMGIGEWV